MMNGMCTLALGVLMWLETMIDIYFILDIFVNFLSAFYEEPDLRAGFVTDLKRIAYAYMRGWFVID